VQAELGVDGTQQPDLGGDLGGQIGERDRRVIAVELDRGLGSGQPLPGPCPALVVVRLLRKSRRSAGRA